MSTDNLPVPVLITQAGQLCELVQELSQEKSIGVDTESNSLFAYREQVCLIQISISEGDFLIDPLSLEDLSPLEPLFASQQIEKIFHAAEYDLIGLSRDFGFEFNNLFDTMVAANILGYQEIGLAAVLESELGIHIDKRYQRANWGQRPLPSHLLAYARLDTHFLIELGQRLAEKLKEKGLWKLAQEDFDRLRMVAQRLGDKELPGWRRINGAFELPPQNLAVLQELYSYREKVAEANDKPLFKIIGDRSLTAIAQALPDNLRELKKLNVLSQSQVRRHGAALVQSVRLGMQSPPVTFTRAARPDDSFLVRLEDLRQWRKHKAIKMGVKSEVVMPRDLLYAIANEDPKNMQELGEILCEVPWRLEHFGEEILKLLS